MKKILSFIVAAALTASAFPTITASAEYDQKDFVVFGDSIAAGDIKNGQVEYDQGEILADYYRGTVANYAVSDADTDDLLAMVKALSADQKKALNDAECVVISIGSNDIVNYACKYMLEYFASPNPGYGMKNFLKEGYTAKDIPQKPTVQDLIDMVDLDHVIEFASYASNAIELITELRTMAAELRNNNTGYIKTHIMENINSISAEIKASAPNAEIIFENIYQPLQLEPEYISKTYNNSNYSLVISQLRDILEGVMKVFDDQLGKTAETAGFRKADILNAFSAMGEGETKSNATPGHTAYFVDIQTGSLSTGDVHPNQKGHLAIAATVIDTIGEKHNDGGLLSDIYENLSDKADYPKTALATYESAAGTYTIGDVNFDDIIDGRDATIVLTDYARRSSGKDTILKYRQNITAEATGDGIVDGRDSTLILTYYAKASAGNFKGTFEEFRKK